jgi:cysteine synthase
VFCLIVQNDISELIGKPPMFKINIFTVLTDVSIYSKLEVYNIEGSVKDRMALYLLEYAKAAGKLNENKTILETTSGNTGIALARISAAKGYKIVIVMPTSVSLKTEGNKSLWG